MADPRRSVPPPTESEIHGADWYGADLSGQSYERYALIDVDLVESSSRGAMFSECHFRECRLNSSRHRDSAFLNCTFTRCTFFDGEFIDCKLVGSQAPGCRGRI